MFFVNPSSFSGLFSVNLYCSSCLIDLMESLSFRKNCVWAYAHIFITQLTVAQWINLQWYLHSHFSHEVTPEMHTINFLNVSAPPPVLSPSSLFPSLSPSPTITSTPAPSTPPTCPSGEDGSDGDGGWPSVGVSGRHDNKAWGMVDWKMSSMQEQVLSQTEEENLVPLEMTRFSRQLVPDRASCSLSVHMHVHAIDVGMCVQTHPHIQHTHTHTRKCTCTQTKHMGTCTHTYNIQTHTHTNTSTHRQHNWQPGLGISTNYVIFTWKRKRG